MTDPSCSFFDAQISCRLCGLRARYIDACPNPAWKFAFGSEKGDFLVEVDSVTHEVLHTLQEDVHQTWYLPFVLSATSSWRRPSRNVSRSGTAAATGEDEFLILN